MEKELKKLKRDQLLEIMLRQQEKIEEQEKVISELEHKLNDKRIAIETCGSIAEASLVLNDVFSAAQAAADQYLENIKQRANNNGVN